MTCERLPFIPDTPNDDLVLLHQLHVSETYACHMHEFYEVFYVVKGQALHEINGVSQVVSEGSLVFIRPNDAHFYQYLNIFDFEFINVNITLEMTAQAFAWLRIPQEAFDTPELPPMLKLAGAQHMEMRRKFVELSEMAPGPARRRVFCALLPEILLLLYDHQDAQSVPIVPQWLSDLLKKLDQPACFTKGLPELLKLTPYTQEHLTRSFRKYVHMSPTAYINQKRLSYAAELLTAQDTAPPLIAQRAGFNNLSHFYHLFRQQYGCTPLQFSQQYRDMQRDQVRHLAHIGRAALHTCLQPNVTRIALEDGLFAYYMQNGRAQIYISFAHDATEHNLNELTTCLNLRMIPGSTVHINFENHELFRYLCSKFHCMPMRQTREMTLLREAFVLQRAPEPCTDVSFSDYDPACSAEYLAIVQESSPQDPSLAETLARCAQNGLFLSMRCKGALAGLAWCTQDAVSGFALRGCNRTAQLMELLLYEAVRRVFAGGAEQCFVSLSQEQTDAADFCRLFGFAQTAHEAVFLL